MGKRNGLLRFFQCELGLNEQEQRLRVAFGRELEALLQSALGFREPLFLLVDKTQYPINRGGIGITFESRLQPGFGLGNFPCSMSLMI